MRALECDESQYYKKNHIMMPPLKTHHRWHRTGGLAFALLVAVAPVIAEELPLSLNDAIRIAKERSFSITRAERALEVAQSRYNAAKAAIRPKFDSSVGVGQSGNSATGDNIAGLKPQFNTILALTLTQPVDISGVIKRQIRQSELQRSGSDQDLAQTDLDLLLAVQNAYYSALRAQEIVRIGESSVANLLALIQAARQANSSNLEFLEVELSNLQQTLTGSRTSLDLAKDNLNQTLRLKPSTVVRLTDALRYEPLALDQEKAWESALEIALTNRPEIKQAHLRIEQARVSLASTDDSRKPTLNLKAFSDHNLSGSNLGQAFDGAPRYNFGISALITFPLVYFDAGFLNEAKRQANFALEQAQADLEELSERIGLELRQSLIAVVRAEQRIKSLPDREQARQSLRQAEQEFLINPAVLAQTSVARSNLNFAETTDVEALSDYNLALFQFKRALGVPIQAQLPATSQSLSPGTPR